MCGITGVFRFNTARQQMAATIQRMADAIRHRGPDDEGYLLIDTKNNRHRLAAGPDTVREIREQLPQVTALNQEYFNLAFGHRRFAILDLSPGGHQPYFDASRKVGGVFNGLIYNYQEVKSELEAHGFVFRTACDTEVLFQAYNCWGEHCFSKLNGTWAVVLYDFMRQELVLSRDRLGKKPIYLYQDDSALYFASEIKAILRVITAAVRINEQAVFDYLTSGCRDLDNSTFFEGITSLPAGTVLRITAEGEQVSRTYWSLQPDQHRQPPSASPLEVARQLRHLLEDAVRIRLRADVPIGIELSGGVDSSAVAGLSSTVHGSKLSCFTVAYPQTQWNEEPYARKVASHFGMVHHVVRSPERWFWNEAEAFIGLHEEPFHSPNLHTQQTVWRLMHDSGIRVILYGAGGDEVFAGYRKDYFYRHLRDLLRRGSLYTFARNFLNFSELSSAQLLTKAVQQFLPSKSKHHLMQAAWLGSSLQGRSAHAQHAGSAEKQLYLNMTRLKMPYWLTSNDKNSLAIPVEVRAPLLDYRVVEFAFQLPVRLLIRDGWLKWILRRAVDDLLPPDITWRRQKMGYPFPLTEWLQASLPIIRRLLAEGDNPFINRRAVCAQLEQWTWQQPELLWRITGLELWHRLVVRGQPLNVHNGTAHRPVAEAPAASSASVSGHRQEGRTRLLKPA